MESGKAKEHDDSSDFEAVAQVVHELYTYRDEVLLVLTKAQGSSMEHMPPAGRPDGCTQCFYL